MDPRYPYTYAYDYIRMTGPKDKGAGFVSCKLSREDVGQIIDIICKKTQVSKMEIVTGLANAYLREFVV